MSIEEKRNPQRRKPNNEKTGEIHAIMGPNGTGKSTLSAAIMAIQNYEVTEGEILFDGKDVFDLEVDERARLGLF